MEIGKFEELFIQLSFLNFDNINFFNNKLFTIKSFKFELIEAQYNLAS